MSIGLPSATRPDQSDTPPSSSGGGRAARILQYLDRIPLVLAVTVLASLPVAYFTARPGFFNPLAKRWESAGDLLQLTIYCLVVGAVLAVLIRISACRYVLVVVVAAWTTVLFGPGAVVTVGAVGVTAHLIGTWLLNRSVLGSRALASAPLALALGYAGLLGVFQAAALLDAYSRFLVVLIVTIVCALARTRVVADAKRLHAWGLEPMSGGWPSIAPLLIGSIQLVYASFAETHSDALVMHLVIPHQLLVNGTWGFDAATYHFATMPKGASWLFAGHYLLAGEPAARLFNATVTFITGWLVFNVVRAQAGTKAGALLAATFLSAPLTFWCVFVMFEDALLTLFTTTAVVLLILTWRGMTPWGPALVALATAAAIATKIQGLLLAVPIALVLGVSLGRARPLRSLAAACVGMAIPALGVGLVPYAVGWFRTGNPLFPFYNGVFRSPLFPPENLLDGRWIGKASVGLLYALTFHTSTLMEGNDGGFGFQHALMMPGVLLAVLLVRRAEVAIPAFCGAGMFLISIAFTQYARYLYPTFPLLAIAAAAVWCRASTERWRPLLVCYLYALIALNVFAYRGLNYFYSFYPPTPFSARQRAQPAYPVERTFNSIVNAAYGRTARVLYLGRPWGAGLDGTALYTVPQQNSGLYAQSKAVKDLEDLRTFLKRNAVTHIMTSDEMTPASHPIIQELLPSVARLEVRVADVALWRVSDSEIRVEPRVIDFGTVPSGAVAAHTVTVWNHGTADLVVSKVALVDPSQVQYRRPPGKDLCSGATLPPGGSCTVLVRFKPMQPGLLHATLAISSSDPSQRIIGVALKGAGAP